VFNISIVSFFVFEFIQTHIVIDSEVMDSKFVNMYV